MTFKCKGVPESVLRGLLLKRGKAAVEETKCSKDAQVISKDYQQTHFLSRGCQGYPLGSVPCDITLKGW